MQIIWYVRCMCVCIHKRYLPMGLRIQAVKPKQSSSVPGAEINLTGWRLRTLGMRKWEGWRKSTQELGKNWKKTQKEPGVSLATATDFLWSHLPFESSEQGDVCLGCWLTNVAFSLPFILVRLQRQFNGIKFESVQAVPDSLHKSGFELHVFA